MLLRKPGALRNGALFTDIPEPLQRLRRALLRKPAGDRVPVPSTTASMWRACGGPLQLVQQAIGNSHVQGNRSIWWQRAKGSFAFCATMCPMLVPRHLRNLLVDAGQHPRGQAYLSSASGLVRVQGMMYVVADDEHQLGSFEEAAPPATPLTLLRVFDSDLPLDKKQRKAAKPDLEALAQLPPLPGCPHGALLALGSGSRPNRRTGVLLALDAHGGLTGRRAAVDLATLYAPLHACFADLNIEGAFVANGELHLLQRGNKGDARNACIRFEWNLVASWLAGQDTRPPPFKAVLDIAVGEVHGVPLGLTDGAALTGGAWVFCAVAEDTGNSYQDGTCIGSAVGVVGSDGALSQLYPLKRGPKVEGIAVQVTGDTLKVTLVTDADDPTIPSQLLEVLLPHR